MCNPRNDIFTNKFILGLKGISFIESFLNHNCNVNLNEMSMMLLMDLNKYIRDNITNESECMSYIHHSYKIMTYYNNGIIILKILDNIKDEIICIVHIKKETSVILNSSNEYIEYEL